jgi:hypothetical protein
VQTRHNADYATLLQDGIVVYPNYDYLQGSDDGINTWAEQLMTRAKTDGLKASLMYFRGDLDRYFWPCVELDRRDGQHFGHMNMWLPSQDNAAAQARPLAEREWGATLECARAKLI